MIPYLLAAIGGYLIGQSKKEPKIMSDGGLMKDFDQRFAAAYMVQQQMEKDKEKQRPASGVESYHTINYYDKLYPARWHDGIEFASMSLHDSLRDSSGAIKDKKGQEIEDRITAYFDEEVVKNRSGKEIHDMWKSGQGLTVPKRKKKWYEL